MLGISFRNRVRNQKIRRRTKVIDVMPRLAELKWNWIGHVARQDSEKWTIRIVFWRDKPPEVDLGHKDAE